MASFPACLDVLIVGAGLSGIGAAYYLPKEHPAKSWSILEARAAFGGTWDLFRYPGVRSDSDLHTFGYAFKPWIQHQAIAGAPDILAYLRQVVADNGMQHKVVGAAWSSAGAPWVMGMDYQHDARLLRRGPVQDPCLRFTGCITAA